MPRLCSVGNLRIGPGLPLAIIAGPCVLESLDLGLAVGSRLASTCNALGLPYIFKASFDKANRSSIASPRGPGLDQGLAWLAQIRQRLNVPVTTDIHEPDHAEPAAAVADLLQIPAFLCRQTDLLVAAARAAVAANRAVNVKKGQFLAPHEMRGPARKLIEARCHNFLFTERGTSFGYGRLINDFLGLGDLIDLDLAPLDSLGPAPVCFDCTHSTQLPGAGDQTGGRPDRAPLLARAAVAAGVHALFLECHPNPKSALSDASTMLTPDQADALLHDAARIRRALS
ncbi:MAG: 3-deoxy-8-phosphooctulonate synthase [Phycisphaerae bacterium]|nr:3-deoxy-8-phosphooctulonate synthase [Phycisphaerae bacterium]